MPGRILVTGASGLLGSAVVAELRRRAVDVVPYDLLDGMDVLDLDTLVHAARGCDVIVHLAAVPTDVPGREGDIGTVNLLGVWHVVLAAERASVGRIVFSSSINAIGVFMGQSDPLRFPIDDSHVARPVTPYSVAKLAAEEILAGASRRSAIATLCLRLPRLTHPASYLELLDRWSQGVGDEVSPYWEYGAYLDVRDAATAVAQGCSVELSAQHDRLLLADVVPAHVAPLMDLVSVAVPGQLRPEARGLVERGRPLVDASRGWEMLQAGPVHHWADEIDEM